MFQSLSGFLMRCDGDTFSGSGHPALFQSLSGFLMRCDDGSWKCLETMDEVSIPIGFSDAL